MGKNCRASLWALATSIVLVEDGLLDFILKEQQEVTFLLDKQTKLLKWDDHSDQNSLDSLIGRPEPMRVSHGQEVMLQTQRAEIKTLFKQLSNSLVLSWNISCSGWSTHSPSLHSH